VKTHLLLPDLRTTACGRDVSHKAAQRGDRLRFSFTRDLSIVDCGVCYNSYAAAKMFLGNFKQFEGSDKPPNEIRVARDGTVVEDL
jgi:hypothetical protein